MKTTEDFTRYCLADWYNYSSQFVPIILKIRETTLLKVGSTTFKPIPYTVLPCYIAAEMAYLAADMIVKGCY